MFLSQAQQLTLSGTRPEAELEPARVLHVLGSMNRGGAETLVYNLYNNIDRTRLQFDFAVHTSQPSHYDKELTCRGARIFALPEPQVAGLTSYHRALSRTLHQYGPFGGVHSHVRYFSGFVLRTAHACGVPIRVAHGHSFHDERPPGLKRSAYLWVAKRLVQRHATHLLGCSRSVCERLYGPKCWGDARVAIAANAIDLAQYSDPQNTVSLRSELGLGNEFLVGHIGSFRDAKNHKFLIEFFAELVRQSPEAHLVLAGNGILQAAIREQFARSGMSANVHFLGVRGDVPQILSSLDVFVFPSLHEGLPTVLIEAQAAGIPCVISDTVTTEVDMHLGLSTFLSLRAPTADWVDAAFLAHRAIRLNFEQRKAALVRAGYEIGHAAKTLTGLYLGATRAA
ncbi:MAG: glycosyltransferase [Acidobacteriota bacterium]|nr:glycosyltransferase [Acidobacteriota bacterium]